MSENIIKQLVSNWKNSVDGVNKFCKDCKHCAGEPTADFDPPCEAPQNFVENVNQAKYLVTGIPQPVKRIRRGASCSALRQQRTPEIDATVCGPEGKWFEPKENAS